MREFEKCIKKGKIMKVKIPKEIVLKEIKEAEYDLEKAIFSLDNKDIKWAIVKAYYSMFHAFRALLFSKGYKEKSHHCLLIAIKELFVKNGVLDSIFVDYFSFAMSCREDADYSGAYNKETAEKLIEYAEEMIEVVKRILNR